MSPWIVLPGLAGLALVYVLAPVALSTFWHWRRPWRLTCPRAGTVAQIRVSATRSAVAEVFGRRADIERCSLWPALSGCRQECLALPVATWRRMRRGEAPPRAEGAATGVRMILVPLDGSPGSEAVLAPVAELARVRGATVRLLRVLAPMSEARGDDDRVVAYADQETARVEAESYEYLVRTARRFEDVPMQHAVRIGDVAAEIVGEAESSGADLIAVATHRRHGLGRLLKGSVAGRLERATTIPLLLVPYGEPAAA